MSGPPDELRELIEISHAVGGNPDWVQGGGGNTSVKSAERLWVKASGTALGRMDERRGWAELDLAAARDLILDATLVGLPVAEREAEVVRRLLAAVRAPSGARPSVESSLHALLGRVVIHTHPIGLNAVLCARDSRTAAPRVVGEDRPPLYIPYVDPGYTLAVRLARELEEYRAHHGAEARVILLENHGLFVVADTAAECVEVHRRITARGQEWIGGGAVNPVAMSWVSGPPSGKVDRTTDPPRSRSTPSSSSIEVSPSDGVAATTTASALRRALLRGGAAPGVVRRDDTPTAAEFVHDADAVRLVGAGAFTPDQIVYCRKHPLLLDPAAPDTWPQAVRSYRHRHHLDPRVLLLPDHSVWATAPDLRQWRVVTETFRAAMTFALRSRRAGGARHLDASQAGFIEDWEVEQFRAREMAGAEVSKAGRVVAFVGVEVPGSWRDRLDAEGVTVIQVGGEATSAPRFLHLAMHDRWPIAALLAVGGVDLLVQDGPEPGEAWRSLGLEPPASVGITEIVSPTVLLDHLRAGGGA